MAAKGKVRRGEIHVRVNVSTTSVSLLRASNAEARTGFLPSQKSTQDTRLRFTRAMRYNSTLKTPDRRTYRTDAGILYH
jgi:hypothetical protein